MFPSWRMSDHFKMCHFVQFIFKETKITVIHKQAGWDTAITIRTHACIPGSALFLFLSLCSACSEATMMAVLGLHSLYTNKVNTLRPLYPVCNQMLMSSPLMLPCGFCWAAFGWWNQEVSSGESCLEGGDGFVSLGGALLWAICLKVLFQF